MHWVSGRVVLALYQGRWLDALRVCQWSAALMLLSAVAVSCHVRISGLVEGVRSVDGDYGMRPLGSSTQFFMRIARTLIYRLQLRQ